jgi:uncharacterized protein YeaO (DUF488 family)
MINIKRVYDPEEKNDGSRFLVERLWPRGIKKEALHMQLWLKDAAPSSDLRKWFRHDPEKWREFKRRYWAELSQSKDAILLLRKAARTGNVTLLYSAHDNEHNGAAALKEFLEK